MPAEPIERIGTLAATARRESQRMAAATRGQADDRHVRLTVGEFRRLAALLDALGRAGTACGGGDCMGATVGGVKLWVTHDRLLSERAATATRPDPLLL